MKERMPVEGPIPGGHGSEPSLTERPVAERLGPWLREEREARQLSLEELAQTTRIPLRSLQLIEEDRFDALPGDVFARGFLASYARALGLRPDEVVSRFDGLRATLPPEPDPSPRMSSAPAERGSGFGIAIALVILLVLFTLALSIVLRPRRRDVPVELSRVERTLDLPCHAPPSASPPWCSAPWTTATRIASSRS